MDRNFGDGDVYIKDLKRGSVPPFHYMSANVSPSVKLISHPVESGGVVFDHKARQPKSVTVNGMVKQEDAKICRTVIAEWLADTDPKGVVTLYLRGGGTYENLMLESALWEENSEKLNAYDVRMNFKEIIFVKTQKSKYNPADSATVRT